jgi:hypothetical protein
MSQRGGIEALEGIRYELSAVLHEATGLFTGEIVALRYQPLSTAISPADKPKPVSLDDYIAETAQGGKTYFQAKKRLDNWTIARLVEADVFPQMWRQLGTDPGLGLTFVSNANAAPLQRLAQLADETVNLGEFQAQLGGAVVDFRRIVNDVTGTAQNAYRLLKQIRFKQLPLDSGYGRLKDYFHGRYTDPVKCVLLLKDLVEKSAGRTMARADLVRGLKEGNQYAFPEALTGEEVGEAVRSASSMLRSYQSMICGVHVTRPETEQLLSLCRPERTGGPVFLLGEAGSGKSVVMRDVLLALEQRGIPVLGIKADVELQGELATPAELGERLALPGSVESVLSRVAENGAVLLVDQLDAISYSLAGNHKTLGLLVSLISRASSIAGVTVIVSCRSFDRAADPTLNSLDAQEVTLTPLTEPQIAPVLEQLEVRWDQLSTGLQGLLVNPLHLRLFAQVHPDAARLSGDPFQVGSLQDLYDLLWEAKITSSSSTLAPGDLVNTVNELVNRIHRTKQLSQPTAVLDRFAEARNYLITEGLLFSAGATVSFFHQSLFDYAFARQFVSSHKDLVGVVVSDQGLFIRPQLLQTLSYIRATDPTRFIRDMRSLLLRARSALALRRAEWSIVDGVLRLISRFSQTKWHLATRGPRGFRFRRRLRYHLVELLCEWFSSLLGLTDAEKALGRGLLDDPDLRRPFLAGASRHKNDEWFRAFLPTQVDELFGLNEQTLDEEVTPFLRSIAPLCANAVFGRLRRRIHLSERWDARIAHCLVDYKEWDNEDARFCVLKLAKTFPMSSWPLELILDHIIEARPGLICDVLKVALESCEQKWLAVPAPPEAELAEEGDPSDLSTYLEASHKRDAHFSKLLPKRAFWMEKLGRVAETCPAELLQSLLPWLERVLAHMSGYGGPDRYMSVHFFSEPYNQGTAGYLRASVEKALGVLAQDAPDTFLEFGECLAESGHLCVHEMLILGLLQAPDKHADWAARYVASDRRRLDVGHYSATNHLSRELVKAISPHLSAAEHELLENCILAYGPEDDDDDSEWFDVRQLEFLYAIGEDRLDAPALQRLEELRSRFPAHTPRHPSRPTFSCVGSPVPDSVASEMTAEQWIEAMREYDDDTHWNGKRHTAKGGVIELSRDLEARVKDDPVKFYPLAERLNSSVSSLYAAAFLRGTAESAAPSTDVFRFVAQFSDRNETAVQKALIHAVEKRVEDGVPPEAAALMRKLAVEARDPETDTWAGNRERRAYPDGPHSAGINSARGQAVRAAFMCATALTDVDSQETFRFAERVAQDPVLSVRACLIEVLPVLLRYGSARPVEVFKKAVESHIPLLECEVSARFIYYTMNEHREELVPYIKMMATSSQDSAQAAAGRLITLAYLDDQTLEPLVKHGLKVSPHFRKGCAEVFARNVDQPKLFDLCARELGDLAGDEDEEVRGAVLGMFRHLPAPSKHVARLALQVTSASAAGHGGFGVSDYLLKHYGAYPEEVLKIAANLLAMSGKSIVDISTANAVAAKPVCNMALQIHVGGRSDALRSKALDVFEALLMLRAPEAREALGHVPR